MNKISLFFISWVVFVCVDMTWIGFIMRNFYKAEMQPFFRLKMEIIHQVMGLFVWALLVVGIMVFVLTGTENISQALVKGALFGLVVYGVYDLTNFVVINNWSLRLLFVDLIWGCCVNAIMSAFIFWLSTLSSTKF
jgi:uncharacterized membrane protein